MGNYKIINNNYFIALTGIYEEKIIVNVNQISSILDNRNGTCIIVMQNDYKIPVNHTIDEMWEIIEEYFS